MSSSIEGRVRADSATTPDSAPATTVTKGLASGADGLGARIRRGLSWNAVGTLAAQGSALLANLIVANLLGRDGFGQFSIILSSILTLAGIAQVATGITATRYVAEYHVVDKPRAARVLRLCSVVTWTTGLFISASLVLAAPWIARHVLKAPELTDGLMVGAGAILFAAVNGFQAGALAGLESYRMLAIASLVQAALHLVLCALGTWLGGLTGAVMGLAVSSMLRWLLFARLLAREAARAGITPIAGDLGQEGAILWRFAVPAAVAGLSALPALWIGQALLARQPNGYAELALYAAGMNLRGLVMFAPLILNNVGMSVLNNEIGVDKGRRYRHVFWAIIAGTAVLAVLGAGAIGLLGPWLLLLFGPEFIEGRLVLLILLVSAILEALALATYQLILSHEKMWLSLLCINLPRDGLIVLLAWVLTPVWGARGLATSYALAWTVTLIVIALIALRLGLNVPPGLARKALHVSS